MVRRPRIAVVGSANIDLVTYTDQFPKPGETIFGQKFDIGFGGKGANQAVAAKLCGAEVFMIARVGNDLFGPATIQNFQARGIDTSHIRQVNGVSSGVAPIFVDASGQNRILVVKGANDTLTAADVDAATDVLKHADCIVLQFEIPLETVYYTVQFKKCAERFLACGVRCVIVTLGANGALLAGKDAMEHIPGFAVKTIDSTGAGDAFIGSFATFLGEGLSEREAVRQANLYAALSTTSPGTQKSFLDRSRFAAEWAKRH